MKKPKIKILVTYKDKHRVLKSDIIVPIQTGRAISEEKFKGMIGDDTGDNISNINNIFSELSAIYWVWKNYKNLGNPDYIGHMHYRRQFLFDIKNLTLNNWWISSYWKFETFNKKIINAFSDNNIRKVVPNYDYLIPDWHDVQAKHHPKRENIRQEYIEAIPGSRANIFDEFIKICKEMRPDYIEEIENIEFGTRVLVCNMFIFKKELFFEYCEFAFPILFELVKRIDTAELTVNGQRFAGYMAEKLLSMYVMKLEKNKNLKEKILTCSYILNPDIKQPSVWENIFSIKNSNNYYKVIKILGLKVKFKLKKKEEMYKLNCKLNNIDKKLNTITKQLKLFIETENELYPIKRKEIVINND